MGFLPLPTLPVSEKWQLKSLLIIKMTLLILSEFMIVKQVGTFTWHCAKSRPTVKELPKPVYSTIPSVNYGGAKVVAIFIS